MNHLYKLSLKPVHFLKKWLVLIFIFLAAASFLSQGVLANTSELKSDFKLDYSGRRLVPIYKVKRDDNKIALTVDGAWGSNKTEALLNLFAEEEIKVSFFFAGIWLKNNPELVKKIIFEGHEIYNHSYTHSHFNSLTKIEIEEELNKTEKVINKFYDREREIKFFRPPYGEYNNLVISTAREMGYQVIQWSLDSHDWMNPGQEYITSRIKEQIDSGEILLFHNNSQNIVEILSNIIPELKKDYQFVKIEELIYNNNYQISSLTGLQYKVKDD